MPRQKGAARRPQNGAKLGFEQTLWQAADKLRGHMDAAEYKHVVLGLIFLKYISDAFQERYEALKREPHADPEDRDEYTAENVFWVPKEARWSHLQDNAKQAAIGKLIDDAMEPIEKANPSLKGVLPKDYNRPALDKYRLGELIDLVADIGLGDAENRSHDILGRVYEYFLGQFASAEGKKGGEFYTPRCVVKLLVEMIEPYKGRVYDPCCGSSGMAPFPVPRGFVIGLFLSPFSPWILELGVEQPTLRRHCVPTVKHTSWEVRAGVICKLNRAEKGPGATASSLDHALPKQ